MNRLEKIEAVLKQRGCQLPATVWDTSGFTEKWYHFPGLVIMVRVHHSLNDMIEVFQLEHFFNAGDKKQRWHETPDFESGPLKWLEEMLKDVKPFETVSKAD